MTEEKLLSASLVSLQANEDYSEAVMPLHDNSKLYFCHRVGERWARAVGPSQKGQETGIAGKVMSAMKMFRLNAKHLDIQFEDGSRWDQPVQALGRSDGSIDERHGTQF